MEYRVADQPLLEMRDISKSFFGVKVLDQVSIDLYAGEVLALVGENGAGKSTLIKILNGDYQKDSGSIFINGMPVHLSRPRDAETLGIRMIYQELHYAPDLSVTENLLLGHLPRRSGLLGRHMVDWPKARQMVRDFLHMLEVDLDPGAIMRDLSVVERQIVEIVKALSTQAKIIVMDEPTAALTPREVELLFNIIRTLRGQGVAVVYISHRLDEIYEIAQRVAVLRDGRHVGTRRVEDVTHRELIRMMVGRDVDVLRRVDGRGARGEHGARDVALEVRGLTQAGTYQDIDLQVHAGEIVGIFGLLGAGHVALTRSIFGAEPIDRGTIRIDGQHITIASPRDARLAGIGLVPIDRKVQGLILDMSVRGNLTLSNWQALSRFGVFDHKAEHAHAQTWVDRLGIRMAGDAEIETRYLSGGNQQKVVLGRWLEANVKVLLLNEPTWGVDVGARSDIYDLLESLAEQGIAILMVSSDIQEVLAVSHRILTMYKGRLTGEFSHAEATQENLLHAAAGGES
ncbi:MAG: sugar ABC transporter ATP-binding protein [Ardenticatenaceae bacterium]|nr:sugar ABC transporter ATP-binding protein [Ardenticatenaceae bacterium]